MIQTRFRSTACLFFMSRTLRSASVRSTAQETRANAQNDLLPSIAELHEDLLVDDGTPMLERRQNVSTSSDSESHSPERVEVEEPRVVVTRKRGRPKKATPAEQAKEPAESASRAPQTPESVLRGGLGSNHLVHDVRMGGEERFRELSARLDSITSFLENLKPHVEIFSKSGNRDSHEPSKRKEKDAQASTPCEEESEVSFKSSRVVRDFVKTGQSRASKKRRREASSMSSSRGAHVSTNSDSSASEVSGDLLSESDDDQPDKQMVFSATKILCDAFSSSVMASNYTLRSPLDLFLLPKCFPPLEMANERSIGEDDRIQWSKFRRNIRSFDEQLYDFYRRDGILKLSLFQIKAANNRFLERTGREILVDFITKWGVHPVSQFSSTRQITTNKSSMLNAELSGEDLLRATLLEEHPVCDFMSFEDQVILRKAMENVKKIQKNLGKSAAESGLGSGISLGDTKRSMSDELNGTMDVSLKEVLAVVGNKRFGSVEDDLRHLESLRPSIKTKVLKKLKRRYEQFLKNNGVGRVQQLAADSDRNRI